MDLFTPTLLSILILLSSSKESYNDHHNYTKDISLHEYKSNIINNKSKKWIIMFHSPNCYHCKQFKPIFNKLAYEKDSSDIVFGSADCTIETKLCKLLRINSYPSLKLIANQKFIDFKTKRSPENLISFIDQPVSNIIGESFS